MHFAEQVREKNITGVVSSSGGNAGMAAAYAAKKLGIAATVVLPRSTPPIMVGKLKALGAQVMVSGGQPHQFQHVFKLQNSYHSFWICAKELYF